jgi:heme/copper-type cytochrome/quinol oxidase subunit 2
MVDGFYRNVSVVGVFVLRLVFYFIVFVLCRKLIDRHTSEYGVLEAIWTLIPIVLLIILAIPSIMLLYISDERAQPLMILKVIGHQ